MLQFFGELLQWETVQLGRSTFNFSSVFCAYLGFEGVWTQCIVDVLIASCALP